MQTRLGRSGEVIQAGRVRTSVQTHSGGSGEVIRVGRARVSVQNHSSGSGKVVCVNSIRWVRRGRPCELVQAGRAKVHPGEQAHIKNAKL